jgi:hypothetical protein
MNWQTNLTKRFSRVPGAERSASTTGKVALLFTLGVFLFNPDHAHALDLHHAGSVSLTAIHSDKIPFNGDTDGQWDLSLAELIVNTHGVIGSGYWWSAQVYAYQLDDLKEVTLDFAQVSRDISPWLKLSLGRVKLPFGLYNEAQDLDHVRTMALLPVGHYPAYLRPISSKLDGLSARGVWSLGSAGSLSYAATFGSMRNIGENTALLRMMSNVTARFKDWDLSGIHQVGQLAWTSPDQQWTVVLSGMQSPSGRLRGELMIPDLAPLAYQVDRTKVRMKSIGLEYQGGRTVFAAEFKELKISGSERIPELEALGLKPNPWRTGERSWYASVSYDLTDRWSAHATYHSFRSLFENENVSRDWTYSRDHSIGVAYEIRRGWIAKLEYHAIRGMGLAARSTSFPEWILTHGEAVSDPDWSMAVAKLTFYF